MIELVKEWWHDFWHSAASAKLKLRAAAAFIATVLAQLDFTNLPTDVRGWAGKLAVAVLMAVALGSHAKSAS